MAHPIAVQGQSWFAAWIRVRVRVKPGFGLKVRVEMGFKVMVRELAGVEAPGVEAAEQDDVGEPLALRCPRSINWMRRQRRPQRPGHRVNIRLGLGLGTTIRIVLKLR